MLQTKPRRRLSRWLRLSLTILLCATALLAHPTWSFYRVWIRPSAPQATWAGPLTQEQRQTIFRALGREVTDLYSYIDLKEVDWPATQERFWPRAQAAATDGDFYMVLQEMLATLRDGHTKLSNYPGEGPKASPPLSLTWLEGGPVVTEDLGDQIRRGDRILRIGDQPVAQLAERVRPLISASTDAQLEADLPYALLRGPVGSTAAITFQRPTGETYTASLVCDAQPQFRQPAVTAKALDGVGYIAISAWGGEVDTQFDAALEQLRDLPGLVIDVRGNGGGDDRLAAKVAARLIQRKTHWVSFQLRFRPYWTPRIKRTVEPGGPWQYRGPIALLIDGRVYSSNDFFVSGLVSSGRVTAFGTPTGGGSGNAKTVRLPGGAQVRISRWREYHADGTPIEGRGTEPYHLIRPTLEEIAAGRDPVLEAAVQYLKTAH